MVVQQHSRKPLERGILMPETCWVSKKKNKNSKSQLVGFLFFSKRKCLISEIRKRRKIRKDSCTKNVCHATARDNVCMKRKGMLMKAWTIPDERPLHKGHCATVSCVICIQSVDAHSVHAVSWIVPTCHSYHGHWTTKTIFFFYFEEWNVFICTQLVMI